MRSVYHLELLLNLPLAIQGESEGVPTSFVVLFLLSGRWSLAENLGLVPSAWSLLASLPSPWLPSLQVLPWS